jgi:HSP20 family protein
MGHSPGRQFEGREGVSSPTAADRVVVFMVIIRKGTGKEMERLQEHMERIFDRVFRNLQPSSLHSRHAAWSPNADVFETETGYEILLEIAGVSRNDVEIIVQANILAIRGRRKEFLRENLTHQHQMEISYGPFERIVALPAQADMDKISADYSDGYLRIRIPKSPPEKARRVEIETE